MKRLVMLAVGVCMIFSGVNLTAQTTGSKYGPDSLQTLEKYSIFTEYQKQKNYEDALPSWRYVFIHAPAFHVNIYQRGESVVKFMLQKTNDKAYLDTLMMLYDQQIQYFSNHRQFTEGYILGKKGLSQLQFGEKTADNLKQAFSNLSRSIELEGDKTSPLIVDATLQTACQLANSGALTRDEFLNLYMKYTDFADQQVNASEGKIKENYQVCRANLDAILFNSGLADCETLVEVLKEKFEQNKEDLATLRMISNMLNRRECTDSPLYTQVTEEIYKLEPDSDAAFRLYYLFFKREDFPKAEQYLKEAIDKSDNSEDKAGYYLRLSQMAMAKRSFPQAKTYAQEALKLNSKLGEAYLYIGRAYAYAAEGYSNDDFEKRSVYWAAVDKFNRAKQVDPEQADDANKLIATYSQYFPTKEEGFFLGVHEGNDVKIGGWINETTKARYNN